MLESGCMMCHLACHRLLDLEKEKKELEEQLEKPKSPSKSADLQKANMEIARLESMCRMCASHAFSNC